MKKVFISALTASAFVVLILPFSTLAATPTEHVYEEIPEKSGVYSEPGKPNIKVRVSVYHARSSTKPTPTTPIIKCELADNESTAVMPKTGWKLPSSVTYRLNPTSVPATVGGSNLETITANRFLDWSMAIGEKVTFTKGPDTATTKQAYDSQNIIAWGRVSSGSTLAVTYTRYDSVTGQVVDNDTIFNKVYSWYWSTQDNCAYQNVYDAENIMTHELGHWVGLADSYTEDYQNNTMFGYGSTGEVKKNSLTIGDIASVKLIYN